VYIPSSTAEKAKNYPEYFAFVLAHELEHVRIYRSSVELHFCFSWLYHHGKDLFQNSYDKQLFKTWDIPHEVQCDKMGKKVSVKIYGEKNLNECLEKLKKIETKDHSEYLDIIQCLKIDPYELDLNRRLSEVLISFLKTYHTKLNK
jgi:hypothetical protein